ncbi:MAG: alpha-glucosidase C-terminal domain-containing protein [Anaerolineales bacterium]|nr:alpha-glucosidase C-terminal domain-containing protein [Anaerolineales bacterium]
MITVEQQIQAHLSFVYGAEIAPLIFEQIQARLVDFRQKHPHLSQPIAPRERVSEKDSLLITYGDQIQESGKPTLQSLAEVLTSYLQDVVSSVHILPFYPYSSDDGFSVIDYMKVDPALGDWADIALLRQHFRLMFDAVINHISAHSHWFQRFLAGDPQYVDYFISIDPSTDLSLVTRPRTLPLLTPFETPGGTQHVWTTFSADQIDLNYKNPAVLLEIIDALLFYVAQGAEFIRLDAIAFMWKEIGTACIHLSQTHRIIQLFRSILDAVAPHVLLITETNVPHAENISYFGDGRNEAQMVYQFSLAPLILHTFHASNAQILQQWASSLEKLPETATFFNFIASHDGIGVRPAEGILSREQIQTLVDKTLAHGGQVSYKNNPDGSQSAYELNITLFDALSDPNSHEPEELKIDRFIASQAIMLALVGVPGIYVHSLVGSSNNYAGLAETGRARTINRQKWPRHELEAALNDPASRASRVFRRYRQLLQVRAGQRAFHPNGEQHILSGNPALFCLLRVSPEGTERVLCLHNISAQPQQAEIDRPFLATKRAWRDLFTDEEMAVEGQSLRLSLAPYEVRWLAG